MIETLIYSAELKRQRTLAYIVVRGSATFEARQLTGGSVKKHYLWKEAKHLFPQADLSSFELATGQSPPAGNGWGIEIVALEDAEVITHGGKVTARGTSRIISHNRAHIRLLDQSIGFAFSGAQLFPDSEATAIAIEGVVVPQASAGANCFVGPEALIASGWPHHPFDGTQLGFEAAWRSAFPTADPPRWPG